ncbi:MAG: PEP-utilizing enzyme, partial [Patescibacteria group bacterium]
EKIYPGLGIDKIVCVFNELGEVKWLLDADEYLRKGKKNFNRQLLGKIKKDVKVVSKKYYSFIDYLKKNGLKSSRLESDFLQFIRLYLTVFATVYPVTGPMTYGYSDYFFGKFLKKYSYSAKALAAIKIFAKPPKSFIVDEQEDLKQIKLNSGRLTSLIKFKKDFPNLYKKLLQHRDNYYWISNNYRDIKNLTVDYFFYKLKQVDLKIGSGGIPITHKEQSLRKYIKKNDINSLLMLGEMTGLQDLRKKANIQANYWLLEFVKRLGNKHHLAPNLSKYLILPEVLVLLAGGQVNKASLRERRQGLINFTFLNREYVLTGRDFILVRKKLDAMIMRQSTRVIKGLVGNLGKAIGRAKVVIDIKKQAGKIKQGDILVTSMTRPEFVPYLRLVKGIVTDEGGITSHAAVVAREFNLPCIIGTKNATQIIKDGDLVEVDANKGVVRKL